VIRAVFFDLDGTLVDSASDLAAATNAMLRELGLPERPVDVVRSFIGEGSRNLVERSLGPPRPDLVDRALSLWTERYRELLLQETRPYPGIPDLLQHLSSAGWTLAVHTNKPGDMAKEILHGLQMESSFAFVLGSNDGPARKPSAEGSRFLMDRLHLSPAEVAYVGDSRIDGETARAAGTAFYGVAWGFRPADEMIAAGARAVAGTSDELERLLLGASPPHPHNTSIIAF
jgi:phosphoglycolate phosphatase